MGVFAQPGSPLDPRCTGINDLIRQGAILTEKAADMLNHIHTMPRLIAEPTANDFEEISSAIDQDDLDIARK